MLYGLGVLMAGSIAGVETITSLGSARMAFECALAVGGVAAMGQWVRRNRAALDQLDWCACAAQKITVRRIPSRQPESERRVEREDLLQEVGS